MIYYWGKINTSNEIKTLSTLFRSQKPTYFSLAGLVLMSPRTVISEKSILNLLSRVAILEDENKQSHKHTKFLPNHSPSKEHLGASSLQPLPGAQDASLKGGLFEVAVRTGVCKIETFSAG